MNCKYCGKECKNANSLRNHERLCKLNPNRQTTICNFHSKGSIPWNKGLTKLTDSRVAKGANTFKEHLALGIIQPSWKGRKHTPEQKEKVSLKMGNNNNGNKAKKGRYRGIWCESQYELAWVIYNIDNNIKFKRFTGHYPYYLPDGSKHNYFPDFILDDGTLIEIKGYHTPLVDIKVNAVTDRKIKVLYKNDLKEIFSYVLNTYNVRMNTIYQLYDTENPPILVRF